MGVSVVFTLHLHHLIVLIGAGITSAVDRLYNRIIPN